MSVPVESLQLLSINFRIWCLHSHIWLNIISVTWTCKDLICTGWAPKAEALFPCMPEQMWKKKTAGFKFLEGESSASFSYSGWNPNKQGMWWPPPPGTDLKSQLCLTLRSLNLVVLDKWHYSYFSVFIINGIALLRLEWQMWGRGACRQFWFFFFSLDCAAPPLSRELVSNEMERFSGLPGARPVLCSTDNVAAPPVGVWPFYATWQQENSATIYLLRQTINRL